MRTNHTVRSGDYSRAELALSIVTQVAQGLPGDESEPGWRWRNTDQLDRRGRVPAHDLDAVRCFRVNVVLASRDVAAVPGELAGGRRNARRDQRLPIAR